MKTNTNISDGMVSLHLGPRRDGGVALALLKDGVATEIQLTPERVEALQHALIRETTFARALMIADREGGQG